MSTSLTRADDKWRDQVVAMEPQFRRALPAHIPAERFVRATETAIMRDPELLACDRKSLFQAVMQCAETGLMPNGRDAALVRYKRAVQFIPMIGGILRLMRNTGEVQTLIAEVVCERDEFFYRLGDDPKIDHTPATGERGALKCAYAILRTKDGGVYREVMSRTDIDKVAKCSRAENGPWQSWYEEMARKTVLRRLAKKCPLSTDTLMDLASRDDGMYDLSAVDEPPSQIDQMRAKLRAMPLDQIESQAPAIEAEDDPQDVDRAPTVATERHPGKRQGAMPDAVFESPAEALADLEHVLLTMKRAGDAGEHFELWKTMLGASFEPPIRAEIERMGQAIFEKKRQAAT